MIEVVERTPLSCRICHHEHEPPKGPWRTQVFIVKNGKYKNQVGVMVEWRQMFEPLWYRLIVGHDNNGREIRENFNPCELTELKL